jgi:hypothetical protein
MDTAIEKRPETRPRTGRFCWLLAATVALSGCLQTGLDPNQTTLEDVAAQIDALTTQLDRSEAALTEMQSSDVAGRAELDARLDGLDEQIRSLPDHLELSCPGPDAVAECEEVARVVVSADKMLVGELEYVYIDPPGVTVIARVDTGATSSSLHAENLVPFERDGEDWVRFDMMISEKDFITVEEKIVRHVRVVQQADPSGSRRPVVEMRVRIGDIQDTFEFTLADRSHLENEVILGRNFLADVTLVDVGKQFIQPRYSPPEGP